MNKISGFVLALVLCMPGLAGADTYEDFFKAVRADDVRTVESLILRGISTNSSDRKLGPAIVLAAQERAYGALRALLLSPATDVNVRNAAGETALMYVALHGELPVARLLVSKGAEVNHPGWTPLHYAASSGQVSMAQYLLEQNAYIDAPSENGTTPLMLAARQKQISVAELLVKEGADPTLKNQAGLTAADYLAAGGHEDEARRMRARANEFLQKYGTREQPVPAQQR